MLELLVEILRLELGILEVVLVLGHLVLARLDLFVLKAEILLQLGDSLPIGLFEVLRGLHSLLFLFEVGLALAHKNVNVLLDLQDLLGLVNFICKG